MFTRRLSAGPRLSRSPLVGSVLLLGVLVGFCAGTRWGSRYPDLAVRAYHMLRIAEIRDAAERRLDLYDETYPVLLYASQFSPQDAVILLPPRDYIAARFHDVLPLLSQATSAYSFIYPRVPVHYGDPSPYRDRLTHLLVWEHWGLDLVVPDEVPSEENRFGIYPLPPGRITAW